MLKLFINLLRNRVLKKTHGKVLIIHKSDRLLHKHKALLHKLWNLTMRANRKNLKDVQKRNDSASREKR